jgi:flavorubredoxin
MNRYEISPGVYWVGVNDRTTDLFEGIWPLPQGISYNSYLVVGDKVALIDAVKAPFSDELLANIARIVPPEEVNYIVVNHMEPDHTGALPVLRRVMPQAEILAMPPALPMLKRLYGIEEGVRALADGEELDLGGKHLRFFHIPFVHWPETMATYEVEGKVLFPCDAFGGFGALDGVLFDDQVNVADYEDETLRYFSNIVGMYTRPVLGAIGKLAGLEIRIIAPSHGLIWRRDPGHIVGLYERWAKMEGERAVTVVYGSMYDHTRRLSEEVARGVRSEGVPAVVLDASRLHVSYLIREAWKRQGLIIGSPTYDGGIYPPVETLIRFLEHKRLKGRVVGLFGSYGWHGGAVRKLAARAEELGWEVVGEVGFQGAPDEGDLEAAFELGRKVVASLAGR